MAILTINKKTLQQVFWLSTIFILLISNSSFAARLKDIAEVEGVRGNQLYGYGLVIGLNGTGDGNSVEFTTKSIANMIEKMGIKIDPTQVKVKNVASVMVTTTLPAFARVGNHLDVHVSSLGDAKSLVGGTLVLTPLRGVDGNVYASAQGQLTVGGFAISSGDDAAVQNHPTSANIAEGAIVERSIPFDLFQSKRIRIILHDSDFTTMTRVVSAINQEFNRPLAVAIDGAAVEVPLAGPLARDPISIVARLEQVNVERDIAAKIVVNERTGTIVMGNNVTIDKVALAHGNLNVSIRSETEVSQPNEFAEGNTTVVNNQELSVGEDVRKLSFVGGKVTLSDIVNALNALGASPRDMISIFNALKVAGALNAELVIM